MEGELRGKQLPPLGRGGLSLPISAHIMSCASGQIKEPGWGHMGPESRPTGLHGARDWHVPHPLQGLGREDRPKVVGIQVQRQRAAAEYQLNMGSCQLERQLCLRFDQLTCDIPGGLE